VVGRRVESVVEVVNMFMGLKGREIDEVWSMGMDEGVEAETTPPRTCNRYRYLITTQLATSNFLTGKGFLLKYALVTCTAGIDSPQMSREQMFGRGCNLF